MKRACEVPVRTKPFGSVALGIAIGIVGCTAMEVPEGTRDLGGDAGAPGGSSAGSAGSTPNGGSAGNVASGGSIASGGSSGAIASGGSSGATTGGFGGTVAGGAAGSVNGGSAGTVSGGFGGDFATGGVGGTPGGGFAGVATGGTGGMPNGGAGGAIGGAGGATGGSAGKSMGGTAGVGGGGRGGMGGRGGNAGSGGSGAGGAANDPCATTTLPGGGTTRMSSNAQGTAAGLTWTIWSNGAAGSITTYNVPAFSAAWNNSGDFLARIGLQWNATRTYDQYGTITAQFNSRRSGNAGGYSYIGIYGWSVSPCVEFYIVDDSYNPMPVNPGMTTNKGTANIDGGTYNLYTRNTMGTGGSKCPGVSSWVQFYSVRRTARTCGQISITAHFDAWAAAGMTLGRMDQAQIFVEAGGGVGNIEFPVANVTATMP